MKTFFWVLGLIASQFYIFKSGTPQPSHIYLAFLSLAGFLLYSSAYRRRLINLILVDNFYVTLLLIYCVFLNLTYAIIYQNDVFILVNLFWVFGFVVYSSFYSVLIIEKKSRIVKIGCVVGLLLIAVFYFVGIGRYNYGLRFNSFFNDPNQMAFWSICVASAYYLLATKEDGFLNFFVFILTALIVSFSMSRGALLGLFIILFGCAFMYLPQKISMSSVFGFILSLAILIFGSYYLIDSGVFLDSVSRLESTDYYQQADIRGYSRIFNYPEYLIFGSGQGLEARFNSSNEIHSSWMGLFFYYGFPGIILFSLFLYRIAAKLEFYKQLFLLAPFVFALTVYGLRAPIIWLLLAVATYVGHMVNYDQ